MTYRFPKTMTNDKIYKFYTNKITLLNKELNKSKSVEYTEIIKEKITQHTIEQKMFA